MKQKTHSSETAAPPGADQSPPRRRLNRRKAGLVAAIAASFCIASTPTRPAEARLELPDDFESGVKFLREVYGYYANLASIYNLFIDTPNVDLVAKLDEIRADIISEVQYWFVDVQLDAAVQSTFDKYSQLMHNPGQSSANQARVLYLTGSSSSNDAGDVFNELERILGDSRDVGRSYKLALPFNALAGVMGHAMGFYDKVFPGEAPFSWWDWHDRFRRTLQIDYQLIGARGIVCWPGYNPNPRKSSFFPPLWMPELPAMSYLDSVLWRKKLANKNIKVGQCWCDTGVTGAWTNISYNPGKRAWSPDTSPFCGEFAGVCVKEFRFDNGRSYSGTSLRLDSSQNVNAGSSQAVLVALPGFNADPVVTGIRVTMRAILKMSGGDEDNGIIGDPAKGEFVNPWVGGEPRCASNGGYAYASTP